MLDDDRIDHPARRFMYVSDLVFGLHRLRTVQQYYDSFTSPYDTRRSAKKIDKMIFRKEETNTNRSFNTMTQSRT